MAAKCAEPGCQNTPEDYCDKCKKNVCKQHGRNRGDYFRCLECIRKFG
jgi:hypothetical protein